MRILFPLIFAIAALSFGQEQPSELTAEGSRALSAAWRGRPGRHGRHGGGGDNRWSTS